MSQITAIIVDDEPKARMVIKQFLFNENPNINIVAESSNLLDAVEQIKKYNPTVVFLDVEMPEYHGYEIINFFKEIAFNIIFITAYDHYAIKAFELNAIDYLLKPIERVRFAKTIERLTNDIIEKRKTIDYHHLLDSIQEKNISKIIIPEAGNRRVINIDEVITIEASGSYSKFHLTNFTSFIVSKTLKYFEDLLGDDKRFFRSHRSYIINLDYIQTLNKKDYLITLTNGIQMAIARGRIEDFKEIMN